MRIKETTREEVKAAHPYSPKYAHRAVSYYLVTLTWAGKRVHPYAPLKP